MADADAPGAGDALIIHGRCSECGGPYAVELWDHTHACEFCGSLLVFARESDSEVFVVSSPVLGPDGDADLEQLYVDLEVLACRASLEARAELAAELLEPGLLIEARVERFRAALQAELRLLRRADFLAPYEVREQTAFQGILGRVADGPKESYLRSFQVEEIERRYDASAWSLRDRGLKIRGFRIRLLEPADLERCQGRFLPELGPGARSGPALDRSRVDLQPDAQVIQRVSGICRERRLRVYKHFTYAEFERGARREHVLFDQQFGQVAARLEAWEAERFASVPALPASELTGSPRAVAIAAECPNCGWQLVLPPQEQIVFCPTCLRAVRIAAKGLELTPYRVAGRLVGAAADHWLWLPCWSFAFRVEADGARYQRIWDWLEAVSPQPDARLHQETDPPASRLYIPARHLHGSPELDLAWEVLVGWLNWRQPALSGDRPPPAADVQLLGVDCAAADAAALVRFALLALHDIPSTRALNGRNFRSMIADAQLEPGDPELVAVPLPIRGDHCLLPNLRALQAGALRADCHFPRTVKSYGLR